LQQYQDALAELLRADHEIMKVSITSRRPGTAAISSSTRAIEAQDPKDTT
jgi:hypothetical protein